MSLLRRSEIKFRTNTNLDKRLKKGYLLINASHVFTASHLFIGVRYKTLGEDEFFDIVNHKGKGIISDSGFELREVFFN